MSIIIQRYGCSIWRHNDVIDTAEKKLIFLLCLVSIISTVSGIYYAVLISGTNEWIAALYRHLLCETPGYIMDNDDDMTTCSKDGIEKYSYRGLAITHVFLFYTLMPLMFLLAIIEWKSFIQKMKVLLHVESEEPSDIKLATLTTSRISNTIEARE